MAKVNKTTDPAEAALSAIEEALNGKATGTDGPAPRLKLPKASMPKAGAAAAQPAQPAERPVEKPAVLEPPPAANQPEPAPSATVAAAPPPVMPPRAAANDDRRGSDALVAALEQKPSGWPLVLAFCLSILWLVAVGVFVTAQYHTAIEQSGGYFTQGNLPLTGAIAIAALVPVIFLFSAAAMMRRAQEMKIAARAMAQAALRLAQPETVAADNMFTLGQAIRREVASMGDGIERAVARASELEALVHSEVSQLERSYTDNEIKIRMLLDELANQREAITNNAGSVRAAIMGAHENLTHDLQTVA
ncbi:MAG: hypothetical protein ACRCTI_08130, partial [Beijerinckiaceae bacterium]